MAIKDVDRCVHMLLLTLIKVVKFSACIATDVHKGYKGKLGKKISGLISENGG